MRRVRTASLALMLLASACVRPAPDLSPPAPPPTLPAPTSVASTPASSPAPARAGQSTGSSGFDTLRANGHEPGWHLELTGQQLTLTADYGQTKVSVPAPFGEAFAGGRRYVASSSGRTITVRVFTRACVDSATGQARPLAVQVDFAGQTLSGCGGDTESLFTGAPWLVQRIGDASLVRGSRVTLQFADGQLTGSTGCNQYTARYTLTGEGLSLGPPVATEKACTPAALMTQAAALLKVLAHVQRLSMPGDGTLVLHAASGQQIVASR